MNAKGSVHVVIKKIRSSPRGCSAAKGGTEGEGLLWDPLVLAGARPPQGAHQLVGGFHPEAKFIISLKLPEIERYAEQIIW